LEGWKNGKLEGWKVGRMECWDIGIDFIPIFPVRGWQAIFHYSITPKNVTSILVLTILKKAFAK
jgi:hypothetical protein